MSIGDRIKQARLEKKISQTELAEKTKTIKQTIYKYENNIITNIPSDKIEAIADVLGVSPAFLMGWTTAPDTAQRAEFIDISPLKRKKYPLVGAVACGEPLMSESSEMFDFDDIDADFALRCKGDSMTGANIRDGDIVLIKQCPEVENGEIAAVAVDIEGECTLKKVYYDREHGRLTLMPCNSDYEPIIIEGEALNEVRILGRAVCNVSMV